MIRPQRGEGDKLRKKDAGKNAGSIPAQEGDRYEQILETSATLFANDGYTRTSLDTVAKTVGIHKATLYYYFDSKEDILETCLNRTSMDVELALRHLNDRREPPIDRLHYFFNSFVVAQTGLYGRCIEAVAWESLRLEPAAGIRQFNHALEDAVGAVLAEGIERGDVRDCDAREVACSMFGAFHWLPRWYQPARRASLGHVAHEFVEFAAQGLMSEKVAELPEASEDFREQQRMPIDRREEIVLLATRCFIEKGYDAASIGDIAQAVGLHKASLYHYFPGKAAILSACVDLAHGDVEGLLEAVTDKGEPFNQRFFQFLRRLMLAQNSEYGNYLYMVRDDQLVPETLEKVVRFRKHLTATLRALVEEGVKEGFMREVDIPLASAYIFGITNGVPRWYWPETDGDLLPLIERILNQLAFGFQAERG